MMELTAYEAWAVAIGLVGIGLSIVGWGLTAWSKRLESLGNMVDLRMQAMENASERRWNEVAHKMDKHDARIHELHIQVERRVTSLETRVTSILEREAWRGEKS